MNKIIQLYEDLKKKHGSPLGQWSLWCKRPKSLREKEEVIIGAILTQNTNWQNVSRAIDNLRQAKSLSLKAIFKMDKEKLATLIRPAGFFNSKTNYLINVAEYFLKNGGVKKVEQKDKFELRKEILDLKGVGPETGDSILLYAFNKELFVIDEYTRRLCAKKKISQKKEYSYLQKIFTKNLPEDLATYQDFHALIVIDAKQKVLIKR
jgi:endonuclease-3 related protein